MGARFRLEKNWESGLAEQAWLNHYLQVAIYPLVMGNSKNSSIVPLTALVEHAIDVSVPGKVFRRSSGGQ